MGIKKTRSGSRRYVDPKTSPPSRHRTATRFDAKDFLAHPGFGKRLVEYAAKSAIFTQGDKCDAIFYIQDGRVKITVVSKFGREATLALLGPGEFIGEDAIAGHPSRLVTASTLTRCVLMRIERSEMLRVLKEESAFSDVLMAFLLARNQRFQEDLIDQLFNNSEKRLARMLLLLSQFGSEGNAQVVIPKLSQETLAEMIGTTRSRVSHFMNRFRKLGFVEYNGGLRIHASLLNVIVKE